MYGTRDAAHDWELIDSQHLRDTGFAPGASSPCIFHHQRRDLRLVVHGDDFTPLGAYENLMWAKGLMQT